MEFQNAGQMGFGVGLCPDEDLAKIQAQKLENTDVLVQMITVTTACLMAQLWCLSQLLYTRKTMGS